MVELYPLLQLLLLMLVYHLFHLKIKMLLTLSVNEKLKNSIFEISIIAQTLNINNVRTTSANSINLHTMRKLIEYSLKTVLVKTMFTHTSFEILLSEGRSVLSPAQWGKRNERFKIYIP